MELKKILPLVIVGMAALVAIFAYSTHNNSTLPNNSALRQELIATENSIPTEAGKKNLWVGSVVVL